MTKAQIYEGGLENNVFRGKARVFEGEQGLIEALDRHARAASRTTT